MPHDHAHPPRQPDTFAGADASVRQARPEDLGAVGEVQAQVWRSAYGHVLPADVVGELTADRFTDAWRQSLADPPSTRHVLLVACAGERVVGFAAVGPTADPDAEEARGELLAIGVRTDAQRAGHGSRLLNAAVDLLRERSFTSATAWLLADDEGTRSFLVGAGMAPDGAYRDRVVDPAGGTAREVRLVADLAQA